jgi:hypothetical protein
MTCDLGLVGERPRSGLFPSHHPEVVRKILNLKIWSEIVWRIDEEID